ncbi:MAG: sensor histidine kinase [Bacteroidaceae bacterium]|nr:sensor histidine kinase [Bacteroidaceae bacterium]
MAWSLKKRTVEYVIYLLFWSVLLLSPLLGAFMKYAIQGEDAFLPTTEELLSFWKFLLPAIILFFINNNILMPFLLNKERGRHLVLYLLCAIVVGVIVFVAFPVDNPSLPVASNIEQLPQSLPKGEQKVWMFFSDSRNVRILLSLFALVFNICVRLFFFTIRRDESIKELEKEKLRSELEYLKYQINPHFFMNSLNNIHALIDIDKVKAQKTVVELSNMMRYVLYDKSSTFVPMEKEVKFLGSYIDLMRLRYTDKIEIKTDFSTEPQGIYVPSLLFMQFLENAFKHGVTYKKKSLIEVSLVADEAAGKVLFTCRNTLPDVSNPTALHASGGIGVENARKRLELLYGDKAQLHISNNGEWYNVELKIPIQYDQVYNS